MQCLPEVGAKPYGSAIIHWAAAGRPLERPSLRNRLTSTCISSLPTIGAHLGLFSKDIATFDDLFLHGLQDIYYAENQILKALPNLIDAATNPQLQRALKDHLKETEGQVARLQQIFEMREEKPKRTKCPSGRIEASLPRSWVLR